MEGAIFHAGHRPDDGRSGKNGWINWKRLSVDMPDDAVAAPNGHHPVLRPVQYEPITYVRRSRSI
jgi:hypothetical protein